MRKYPKIISILITLISCFLLGFISIKFLGDYGWTVFVIIPLFIGFLPPFLVGRKQTISLSKSYEIGFLTLLFACLTLIVCAFEGLVCITMALPIFIPLTWLGAYIGFKLNQGKFNNPTNTVILIISLSITSLSFDYANEDTNLIAVKTSVIINSPIHQVWKNVVTFNKIEAPTDWIFKTGISYPINATIKGKGVGALRYCNFTTGSFVEPITIWNEPNLLQFSVESQPIPMNEFNPFWEIHPPHLDGYFNSKKGQFKLSKINENQTKLEGTTWYEINIKPEIYWSLWSDLIIHRIHNRVLIHIKQKTESN